MSDRFKATIGYADVIVGDKAMTDDLRAELRRLFSPSELEELTLTISMVCGMSKSAIAWGPPPEMPTTEMPTPSPEGSVA